MLQTHQDFLRLPPKLAPVTALQALAQFKVLLTTIAWPAESPDMSCHDFWFGGLAMEEVRKSRPSTLN